MNSVYMTEFVSTTRPGLPTPGPVPAPKSQQRRTQTERVQYYPTDGALEDAIALRTLAERGQGHIDLSLI